MQSYLSCFWDRPHFMHLPFSYIVEKPKYTLARLLSRTETSSGDSSVQKVPRSFNQSTPPNGHHMHAHHPQGEIVIIITGGSMLTGGHDNVQDFNPNMRTAKALQIGGQSMPFCLGISALGTPFGSPWLPGVKWPFTIN